MSSRSILSPVVLSLLFASAPLVHAASVTSVAEIERQALEAESQSSSAEETKADAAQAEFESRFELDRSDETSGEPDFAKILRRSVVRKVGKKRVSVVPSVRYGVVFTGPSTYREGSATRFPPASTNKIFTSAFILRILGGDYRYETELRWEKPEPAANAAAYLTFVGAGDPSLTTSDLPKLSLEYANALAAAGVKTVYGALRFSATDARWSRKTIPYGWEAKDRGTADGFIPDALGTLSEARVKAALASAFTKKGVKWLSTAAAPFPESAGEIGRSAHRSAPLRELIRPFVEHSINYKGEAFLRKAGELFGSRAAPDLHAAGLPLLREFVAEMLLASGGFENVVLNDGSGLSRESRVTAAALVNFLAAVKSEPYFADFLAALPVAARTGTLAHRMGGTNAAGRVHAKTGTLDGNYQLAGYLAETTNFGTEYHPFAVLTGTSKGNAGYCRAVEDAAMASLATWMLKK